MLLPAAIIISELNRGIQVIHFCHGRYIEFHIFVPASVLSGKILPDTVKYQSTILFVRSDQKYQIL